MLATWPQKKNAAGVILTASLVGAILSHLMSQGCTGDGILGSDFVKISWVTPENHHITWLLVWNIFPHILGIIIPTDYIICFRGVETTNQHSP